MLADLSGNAPRVIALIDLADLRSQLTRGGGASDPDLAALVEQLEVDLAGLDPGWSEARLALGTAYVYSPDEADRSLKVERVVFREPGRGIRRECQGCGKACTHCQGGALKTPEEKGRDSRIANDLIELAREDAYDWAVVVSTDLLLIPVVRYLQAHGRKIIHGRLLPIAMDLTKECWASIDLRVL
jgi:hypothetical protein